MSEAATYDSPFQVPNIKRFIAFRILFNARFYYPVFTVLFLDFGLTLEQFNYLNAVWAITIVLLEVPSGALADVIGRKNLVVASATIMVIEMLLLCFAPIGNTSLVFYLFLINRILSGAAEASASGADEALAYDSLKAVGLESKWNDVLEKQMRLQSFTFVIAMTTGALVYDATLVNSALALIGMDWTLASQTTLKIPLFLTLILAFAALAVSFRIKDIKSKEQAIAKNKTFAELVVAPVKNTLTAGGWILKTPAAFAIILCGLLFDHVIRQVLTINSEFYRQIFIPEWSFGLIGSALAMCGVFMPKLGNYLVTHRSPGQNFLLLGVFTFLGLWLMSYFIPIWGAAPMIFLYGSISLTGYFVSNYLNRIAASETRATVLSFKGLSFNLAYGGIAYLFGTYVYFLRSQAGAAESTPALEDELFQTAFGRFPIYFVCVFALVLCYTLVFKKRITTALSSPNAPSEGSEANQTPQS